jgi:hypothetical protein
MQVSLSYADGRLLSHFHVVSHAIRQSGKTTSHLLAILALLIFSAYVPMPSTALSNTAWAYASTLILIRTLLVSKLKRICMCKARECCCYIVSSFRGGAGFPRPKICSQVSLLRVP